MTQYTRHGLAIHVLKKHTDPRRDSHVRVLGVDGGVQRGLDDGDGEDHDDAAGIERRESDVLES